MINCPVQVLLLPPDMTSKGGCCDIIVTSFHMYGCVCSILVRFSGIWVGLL